MAVDRREANLSVLAEADEIQGKSKEAIWRIQKQAAETEQIGTATLEELRKQSSQIDDINAEVDNVSAKLDQSQTLQNQFDRWAGNWFGGKKREALREAQAEIAAKNSEEMSKIKEVFQHEKFESFSRTWKPHGLVLCNNPTIAAPELFDPDSMISQGESSNWIVDYSLAGIDAEGWTYAYDYDTLNKRGVGESSAKFNSYVRRRKWRYVAKNGGGNAVLQEVRDRNAARMGQKPIAVSQADKIGYVPRSRQAGMTASGLTSAGMMSRGKKGQASDQDLDEESANGFAKMKSNDVEIDDGVDKISAALDNLAGIASSMRSEVISQNAKLDRLDDGMSRASDKQAIVNARQRKLLSSNS